MENGHIKITEIQQFRQSLILIINQQRMDMDYSVAEEMCSSVVIVSWFAIIKIKLKNLETTKLPITCMMNKQTVANF